MPYITVFTPVFNRAHTLDRLYSSLLEQTYRNFEWVVVDDGSSDESVEKIKKYICDAPDFKIKLIENQHGGKHRAVNTGLGVADGKLFFMLDSDDWLKKNALETVIKWEKKIPKGTKCAGLCGCMEAPNGSLISKGVNEAYIYKPLTQMIKQGVVGDHADILYTEVFRKYPYPEIVGETDISPGVPFVRMANDGYNLLFFNEVVYIAEYGPDGLTAMGDKNSLDNFQGYTLRSKELIASDIGVKRKIQILIKYNYLCRIKKISATQSSQNLNIGLMRGLAGYFLGSIYYVYKMKRC